MTLHLLLYRILFRKKPPKYARVRQNLSQIALILQLTIYWTRSFWVFSRRTLWFLNSVEPNQVYGVVICFLLTNLGWIRFQMFRFFQICVWVWSLTCEDRYVRILSNTTGRFKLRSLFFQQYDQPRVEYAGIKTFSFHLFHTSSL